MINQQTIEDLTIWADFLEQEILLNPWFGAETKE